MNRTWLGSFATVMMMLLACGDDPDESATGTGDSSSSESGSVTNPTTDPTVTSVTVTDSDEGPESTGVDTGTIDTGTVDTGSSGGSSDGSGTTSDPDTGTSAGDSSGDSGSSSSGEPPVDDYPSCMADDECTDPYTLCWPPMDFGDPNFCTLECTDAKECPIPSTGDAVPVCEGPPGTDVCVLDCTDGDCPDGMDCIDIFGNGAFLRCTRA